MTTKEVNDLINHHIYDSPHLALNYCEDGEYAMLVLQACSDTGVTIDKYRDQEWRVSFHRTAKVKGGWDATSWAANKSLSLAICLAALRYAGVVFENEEHKPHYWENK